MTVMIPEAVKLFTALMLREVTIQFHDLAGNLLYEYCPVIVDVVTDAHVFITPYDWTVEQYTSIDKRLTITDKRTFACKLHFLDYDEAAVPGTRVTAKGEVLELWYDTEGSAGMFEWMDLE